MINQKIEKISFQEYWKNIVGKVAELSKEIEEKQTQLNEFLLNTILDKAVLPEDYKAPDILEKHVNKIEYEPVTIKVPKPIMAFLQFQAGQSDMSTEELIEYDLLDSVRGEMENFSGEELITMLNLGHIFYEILGDEHYKPQEKTN